MTNTHIGLFRHGQTDWNIKMLLQGVTDVPMNSTGIEQVRTAARAINGNEWDLILTSPLGRARQTAEIIAEQLGFQEVHQQDLLIERSFGEAEGLAYEEWKSKYSNLDELPGGESKSELLARSKLLMDTFADSHPGNRILAISHGALIRTVLTIASDNQLPRDGERLGNASLNVVSHQDSYWSVTKYDLDPLSP
ncbi:MAG: histidine phosphatase family protein [Actinobacteria bacterium]|nr:histidine phosphatase family protein [Actinomycetota bacterium]